MSDSPSQPQPKPQPARYRAQRLAELRNEGRWGVYNEETDRLLDVRFGSEREAAQAATFLCKVRVR